MQWIKLCCGHSKDARKYIAHIQVGSYPIWEIISHTIKVITVNDTDKPWITNDLKNLIKTRCRLHIAGDFVASAKLRNHIVKLKKCAKRQYVRDKITPLLTIDPHKWHSSVKRLTGKTTLRDLRLLKEDGTLTSANEVNSFFC